MKLRLTPFLLLLTALVPVASAQTPDPSTLAALDLILNSLAPDQERVVLGDARYKVSALKAWRDQLARAQSTGKDSDSPQPLVTNNPFNAWTGGIVYYTFNANVTLANRQRFLDATVEWATYANIQFLPRVAQPNYTEVLENPSLSGGLSDVGMIGGKQEIEFGPSAWNRPTLLHELGHTLGLQHEHQRPDRDSYVTILSANILAGQSGNFVLLGSAQTHATPYDFRSVMHYARNTLSSNATLNTIVPKPAYSAFLNVMGDFGNHLSQGDRSGMALLYGNGPALSSVVTNTKDSGPGSLRQCLAYAADHPGTTISFNIPLSDPGFNGTVWTIRPTGALPALTSGMVIDASTQPGNTNPNGPEIVLSGLDVGPDDQKHGLEITGSGITVRGFIIHRFLWSGVAISGAGASNNKVEGCYLGTNPAGTAAEPNGIVGIEISEGATNNTIGGTTANARNVISGSPNQGLTIHDSGSNGNLIQGNYIGLNATGSGPLPNAWSGIQIFGGAQDNTVGGTTPNARNVISGNTLQGVSISGAGTNGNKVQGNYIGTDLTGVSARPNGWAGVDLFAGAQSNIIGGTASGTRNVISGNGNGGVAISGANTSNNLVQGNYLGTDANGSADLGNAYGGVDVFGGASSNTIGGTATGARNVISGNDNGGIAISGGGTNGNIVQGNYIGTDVNGTADLGNAYGGVDIFGGASSNIIGGTAPNAGNVISGNDYRGVSLSDAGTNTNLVQGNLIGLNASGSGAIANARGVEIYGGAQGNTVGGSGPGSRNYISGNAQDGLFLTEAGTSGNSILGNTIGLDLNGAARGNGGSGLVIYDNAASNIVGGAGAGNIITRSQGAGVALYSSAGIGNRIRGNRIFANNQSGGGWREIDLLSPANFVGQNTNDTDDPDNGPNGYQNHPVLGLAQLTTSGSPAVAMTAVSGSLNSNPSTSFTIEFFASAAGNQAEYWVGTTNVTTDAGGDVSFTSIVLPTVVPIGWRLTATATSAANNSSELSPSIGVTGTDTDGDGMPNAYETGNGLNPNVNDATGNLDGDQWTNIEEMRLGTNPQGYSAGLDLSDLPLGVDMQLQFPSLNGRIYGLRYSDTLGAGARWMPLADGLVGTGGTLSLLDPQASSLPRRFYQLLLLP